MTRLWGAVPVAVVLVTAGHAPAQDAALVQKGERLFMEQGCYGCHTVGKVGTQGIAPDLSHVGGKHDVASRCGRRCAPGFPTRRSSPSPRTSSRIWS